MQNYWHSIFIFFLIFYEGKSILLLNESFTNLTQWTTLLNGANSVVKIQNNVLFTNVSQCSNNLNNCYRAEIVSKDAIRTQLISNWDSSSYWIGFSTLIPSKWKNGISSSLIYNFIIRSGGGSSYSPILGLRIKDGEMSINICGGSYANTYQSNAICSYHKVGLPSIGMWVDWVINIKLSHRHPNGFVKVWRNGKLMLDIQNILTSFPDKNPPYLELGSFAYNWLVGIPTSYAWTSVSYNTIRLGNSESSYNEVYTGSGAECGVECDLATNNDDTTNDNTTNNKNTIKKKSGIIGYVNIVLENKLYLGLFIIFEVILTLGCCKILFNYIYFDKNKNQISDQNSVTLEDDNCDEESRSLFRSISKTFSTSVDLMDNAIRSISIDNQDLQPVRRFNEFEDNHEINSHSSMDSLSVTVIYRSGQKNQNI
eukprot:gene6488-8921_t